MQAAAKRWVTAREYLEHHSRQTNCVLAPEPVDSTPHKK
jgi:hypothetical protein